MKRAAPSSRVAVLGVALAASIVAGACALPGGPDRDGDGIPDDADPDDDGDGIPDAQEKPDDDVGEGEGEPSGEGEGEPGGEGEGEPDPCAGGGCADLALSQPRLQSSLVVRYEQVDAAACEVQQGCATAGARARAQFDLVVDNEGAALDLGAGSFADGACTDAPTLVGFAAWRVVDVAGATVKDGTLDVACLRDGDHDCAVAQGVASGATSVAATFAPCSFVDLTDVPAGDYDLEVVVNATGVVADADPLNDVARAPLFVPDLACDGVVCGGFCCAENRCEAGVCMMADLAIDAEVLVDSQQVETTSFGAESCALLEGCVAAAGDRRILRFSTTTPNIGEADLYLGPPAANPLFHFSECHDHWHFDEYAEYRLLNAAGDVVANGHKQAFCLIDLEQVDENAGGPQFDCENQGISKGWADTYASHLDCQWIDVTGIPPGDYVLEVRVNPAQILAELDYTNNVARVPVTLPDDPYACFPSAEICGDGRDQDCDGAPDQGCAPIAGNGACATAYALPGNGTFTATLAPDDASDLTSTCGGAGGEATFTLVVPTTEMVYASTYGSSFDTVLSLRRGTDCAEEITCADDACGGGQASLLRTLTSGTYTLAVKAKNAGEGGTVKLKVQRAGCANVGRIAAGETVAGDTEDAVDDVAVGCGGDGAGAGPDEMWAFTTCPGTTTTTLTTCSSTTDFDSMLEVREGACLGRPVIGACSDDDDECGPNEKATTMTVDVEGDGVWFVVVDGYYEQSRGPYSLSLATP